MCRLLGFVAQPPTTLGHLLGADLASFTELSMKHGDGWGVATPTDTGVDVCKSTEAARTSRGFTTLAREHVADAGMVHLRWATLGLVTEWDNTHPFTDGRVAFAHNGSISPPAALDGLIAPDLLDQRRGDTDSERYFLVLLTHLRATPGPRDALAATIAEVSQLHLLRPCRRRRRGGGQLLPAALQGARRHRPRRLQRLGTRMDGDQQQHDAHRPPRNRRDVHARPV